MWEFNCSSIYAKNRVELFDDYFMFYYGFGKQKIYIKDIKEIKKSHNPIASSAIHSIEFI